MCLHTDVALDCITSTVQSVSMTSGILLGSVTLDQSAIRATYTCESFSLMSFKYEYTNMHFKKLWMSDSTDLGTQEQRLFFLFHCLPPLHIVGGHLTDLMNNTRLRGTRTSGHWKTITDCAYLYRLL